MGRITNFLVAINVAVFILVFSLPQNLVDYVFSAFSFSMPLVYQLWRLFTSIFLHAGASHIFFNMIGLYYFGNIVEENVSGKAFLLVYFLSGLAGNIAFGLTSASVVVGASGCVFGLMGAAMLLDPKRSVRVFAFPLPVGIVAILYAIAETMLLYSVSSDGIAHIAHVVGLLTGGFIAFAYLPTRTLKGALWLIVFFFILAILSPFIGIIVAVGSAIMGMVDVVAGFFLYGAARAVSVLWTYFL
ncbi:MAG: rhomboid family intramembrane serine protease [Candidatus Micrarchaeota archaeon]|nr:rhomboid family intramembrane serine protease [Candidatus Micrarchaeota archaeon]